MNTNNKSLIYNRKRKQYEKKKNYNRVMYNIMQEKSFDWDESEKLLDSKGRNATEIIKENLADENDIIKVENFKELDSITTELLTDSNINKQITTNFISEDEKKITTEFYTEKKTVKISIIIEKQYFKTETDFNEMKTLKFKISDDLLMEDLVKLSIEKFNQKFEKNNFSRRFENNYSNYKFLPASKHEKKQKYYFPKSVILFILGLIGKDISAKKDTLEILDKFYDKNIKVSSLPITEFILLYKKEDLIKINKRGICFDCCTIM